MFLLEITIAGKLNEYVMSWWHGWLENLAHNSCTRILKLGHFFFHSPMRNSWNAKVSMIRELVTHTHKELLIFSSWKAITNTITYIILILSLFDHNAMPTRDHCDTHCFDNSGCDGWSVTSSAVELGMFEYCRSWWLRE